ncbi:MAG: flagellar basal body-associated FliL family protein [Defluviitaleaceae bacterium]|nr:flagellar basal body-associated FliL family protein [Defluviitaleaceae bacterium]
MDKSKMMMAVIILLLVLLLGTVVAVSFLLMNRINTQPSGNLAEAQIGPITERVLTPADMRLVPLGQQTANLQLGPGGRNDNIVVSVEVGLDATVPPADLEDFYAAFNRSIPAARSVVFDILVERTFDEVRTLEGRAETSEIIKYALQEAFGSNLIVDIFFDEWNVVKGW